MCGNSFILYIIKICICSIFFFSSSFETDKKHSTRVLTHRNSHENSWIVSCIRKNKAVCMYCAWALRKNLATGFAFVISWDLPCLLILTFHSFRLSLSCVRFRYLAFFCTLIWPVVFLFVCKSQYKDVKHTVNMCCMWLHTNNSVNYS